ncbi:hypothetical protein [Nocardia huaxiensis]|uniref:Uncharacterized protein n=1 Tax=Nocardia huaxiensis TaxID=2755382 RepID=A0A7D6ZF79_9NOCA|nr:hypothetical protein [Nocardia huaxiensis]QLY28500.1 hypothetical protein H0264_24420 [Nocardia huaxiensis]UFS98047.1 hypothetical protein LPY97_09185 [Nocardia huaxiensis]
MSADNDQRRGGPPAGPPGADAGMDEQALSARLAGDETQERLVDSWLLARWAPAAGRDTHRTAREFS